MKQQITPPEPATINNFINGELLTVKEVADLLKVSRKTLYQWGTQGKIHFVKIAGTVIRIRRADLTNIISEGER